MIYTKRKSVVSDTKIRLHVQRAGWSLVATGLTDPGGSKT